MKTRKCQYRTALELFPKIGSKATPEQIDKHVGGTGSYYSKRICYLRIWGFEFDVEKEGRKIISYTLTKEPTDAEKYRTGKPVKEKKVKAVAKTKTKVAPKAKTKVESKKEDTVKASNLAKIKAVAEKKKEEKKIIESAPAPSSFAVDPDFDSVEDVDISALV